MVRPKGTTTKSRSRQSCHSRQLWVYNRWMIDREALRIDGRTAGAWLVARLHGAHGTIGGLLPVGFEGYVGIAHDTASAAPGVLPLLQLERLAAQLAASSPTT